MDAAMPVRIVLPSANQARPLTSSCQSDNTNGSLAPSIAPMNAPTAMPIRSPSASGSVFCVRRLTSKPVTIAAPMISG
jgi:hypothetical protein